VSPFVQMAKVLKIYEAIKKQLNAFEIFELDRLIHALIEHQFREAWMSPKKEAGE